jgi:hypothetical protein
MSQNNHSAKKAAVLQRNKSKLNPVTVTLALALVVSAAAVAYYLTDASVAPSKAACCAACREFAGELPGQHVCRRCGPSL